MKYVVIGSALAGNKGAASMLEASIQSISKVDKDAKFNLFSLYAKEDMALNSYSNLKIVGTSPMMLGLVINPLAIIYKIVPPLRSLILKNKHLSIIKSCDVYLDQAGITFVDGREKFLLYNIAIILPALCLNKKIVKCSQALGPFNHSLNKFMAKLFLPRVDHIFARGQLTANNLRELDLKNYSVAYDYAFLLKVSKNDKVKAEQTLSKLGFSKKAKNIGVFPSIIMKTKLKEGSLNYAQILATYIDKVTKDGAHVYLIPHSQRADTTKLHNNDLPVCQEIYEMVNNKKQCRLIEDNLSAQQLRAIIGAMDFNISARFHAMVSSLAVGVPVLVTGWNHKYEEVLNSFDMADCALKLDDIDAVKLYHKFNNLYANRAQLVKKIHKNLEQVKISAENNTRYIIGLNNK